MNVFRANRFLRASKEANQAPRLTNSLHHRRLLWSNRLTNHRRLMWLAAALFQLFVLLNGTSSLKIHFTHHSKKSIYSGLQELIFPPCPLYHSKESIYTGLQELKFLPCPLYITTSETTSNPPPHRLQHLPRLTRSFLSSSNSISADPWIATCIKSPIQ